MCVTMGQYAAPRIPQLEAMQFNGKRVKYGSIENVVEW